MPAASTMAERRSALTAEQGTIRAKRGAAVLDGHRFDDRRLREIDSELDRMDDAEAESTRREREAATAAEKVQKAARLAQARECNAARVKALEAAESGARAMCEALRTFFDNTAAVGDGNPSSSLSRRQTEQRISRFLASMLTPLSTANSHGFGFMTWLSIPPEFRGRWAKIEQTLTRTATAHLTEQKEQAQ
jgi:hypothetical protein